MRGLVFILSVLITLPANAQSHDRYSPPSAEELREALFGVHLFGTVDFGEIWNECIEKDGDTLYTIGGREVRGKAWIPSDGRICFTYGDDVDHCFAAIPTDDGWVFRGGGTTWQTTQVRENVEVCLLSDMIG